MSRKRTFLSIFLLAALLLTVVACSPAGATPGAAQTGGAGEGGITVVGTGEAFGAPDTAEVQLGAETFAPTVAEATSQNEALVEAIMAALAAQGMESRDIRTSNYSLWAEQVYGERGPEGIAGYRVSNLVTVTIRDINAVSAVIGAVTEAGANNIHGVSFRVADPAALEDEARAAAIANARARAESLAELSGVTLGEIVSVSEVITQPGIPLGRGAGGAMDEAASASISAGELGYTIQVQVTFAIG
jgi:uncharacterized protein YggE